MRESSPARDSFKCVYRPDGYQQLMMIKMLLDRENVNYYIEGEQSYMMATPDLSMRVMVDVDRAEEIKNALRDELGLK